jgi:hypothetical protein
LHFPTDASYGCHVLFRRVQSIENLQPLRRLRSLFIGKNRITALENLESLEELRVLSAQSNRLTRIGGLEALTQLEELYQILRTFDLRWFFPIFSADCRDDT